MVWLTNKKTGAVFNTDWLDKENQIEQSDLKKQSQNWYYNNLTSEEQTAVVKAQVNTQQLNSYLRTGKASDAETAERYKKQAELLDSALAKFELKNDIVTYRGVNEEEFTDTLFGLNGDNTDSFKSTSYDEERALAFAKNQGGWIIEYHIKAGHNGADVNGAPGANENEFLIRHNIKQTVISKPNKTRLIVEIG